MSTELRVENYSLEKNNMLTNHNSNRNRNMSRIDEGKESETNEDKQKNEVRDTFTTILASCHKYTLLESQLSFRDYPLAWGVIASEWFPNNLLDYGPMPLKLSNKPNYAYSTYLLTITIAHTLGPVRGLP